MEFLLLVKSFNFSKIIPYGVLITFLMLTACHALTPKPKAELPSASLSKKTLELDAQTLSQALEMVSSLTLRVEADRYQSELFQDTSPGGAGEERRAHWLETQFQLAGLLPAGDPSSGQWRFQVPLRAYRSESTVSTSIKGNTKTFHDGQGIELWSTTPLKEIRIDRSEATFISSDALLNSNSSGFQDLRGKIVLMREAPRLSISEQYSWAAHQGIAVFILIRHQGRETSPTHAGNNLKDEHFILRTAQGNSDHPLVMGRIGLQQAQTAFGLSEKELTDSRTSKANSDVITVIHAPIHIQLKNDWRDCFSIGVAGRIRGGSSNPNEASVVFRTDMQKFESAHFAALITTVHALSRPGEFPQKNIIFLMSGPGKENEDLADEDLAWRWWQMKSAINQGELAPIQLNLQISLQGQALENDASWLRVSELVKSKLQQIYQQAGPWEHH